jgi:hypothetical protein
MRENRAANLLADAALLKNGFPFRRMVGQVGMNLPIKIVQQRGDGPFFLVLAELLRVGGDAGFDRQHMFAQAIRLHEFADNVPGLLAVHKHSVC